MNDLDPRWQSALDHHRTATTPTPDAWAAIVERAGADDVARAPSPPVRAWPRWVAAAAALLVVGVGALAVTRDDGTDPVTAGPDPTTTAVPGPLGPQVEGIALVLEDATHGPVICTAGMDHDLVGYIDPPARTCEGVPIEGWDWGDVTGELRNEGAIDGRYHLTGRFAADHFVLEAARDLEQVELGSRPGPFDDEARFATPCPEPPGGWVDRDPSRATFDDRQALLQVARQEADLGEVWVDNAAGVVNASFTTDLDRHRRELEAVYGGPLCVSEAPFTQVGLRAAARLVDPGDPTSDPVVVDGLLVPVTLVRPDTVGGGLDVSVLHAPPGTREVLEEVTGVPVELDPTFTPVG